MDSGTGQWQELSEAADSVAPSPTRNSPEQRGVRAMALEGIKPENGGLEGTWGCRKAFQCQGWRSEQSKAALTCGTRAALGSHRWRTGAGAILE